MKKLVLTGIVLILTSFMMFIHPADEIGQHSFKQTEESVITAAPTVTDAQMVLEYVQTTWEKSQTITLFLPMTYLHMTSKNPPIPKEATERLTYTAVCGFICVAHHQSNYLI